MTTLKPRTAYTGDELHQLYPQELHLRQVQILLRHGERTPISSRFKNAGLATYWPYCSAAEEFRSAVINEDKSWDSLPWKRRIEVISERDLPVTVAGAVGETKGICQPGELTDRGRETTLALGQRIRKLYVDQLGFLPSSTTGAEIHLRSSPIPRALESVQQVFVGLYPPSFRIDGFTPPAIVTRSIRDETLFPNEASCKRFRELFAAFSDRAAGAHNGSPALAAVNSKLGKWMPQNPDGTRQRIAVDGKPRLSGILDTINSTRAHGPQTKLPTEFYDDKTIHEIDKVCVEEWFAGYQENQEFRKLGIGALVGDLTQRMVEHARGSPTNKGISPATGADFKISLAGCHDTTLAATLTALGGFDAYGDAWPPYTSSIAFELFQAKQISTNTSSPTNSVGLQPRRTWWSTFFGQSSKLLSNSSARTPFVEMSEQDQAALKDYYVRVRYNDKPIILPYCKAVGRHFGNDEGLCTLKAFKEAADTFTPRDWKQECGENLGAVCFAPVIEPPPGV